MTGHRRAAAALHGLQEEDRQWLLTELPDADRDILNRLLGELTELGFEPGSTASASTTAMLLAPQSNAADLSSADIVRNTTARHMSALLEHEPSSLIAQVLGIETWPWEQAFLQMLSPLRRDRIAVMSEQMRHLGPARKACLLDGLAKRLRTVSTSGATSAANVHAHPGLFSYRQAFSAFLQKVTQWNR